MCNKPLPTADISGAGELTTCSKAIYDFDVDPAKLIGVVGVDVLVSASCQGVRRRGSDPAGRRR